MANGPGLFERLKQGTIGLFAGPEDPRLPAGTGNREGLINSGLATIASGNQDPWEAIAIGAQAGRAAGQEVRERQLSIQQRAALSGFIEEAGYDREGLTSVFFKTLASGDMEGAKSISEILKSLPKETETRANLSFSTHDVVNPETGVEETVRIGSDQQTGRVVSRSVIGAPAPTEQAEFDMYDPSSPTGYTRVRVVDGAIVPLAPVGGKGGAGGTGGAEAQKAARLIASLNNSVELAFANPEQSTDLVLGTLGQWGSSAGVKGALARALLNKLDPSGKTAISAAAAAQMTGQLAALLSGATVSDRERAYIGGAYALQANDPPAVWNVKLQGVMAIAQAKEEGVIVDVPESEHNTPAGQAALAENRRVFTEIEAATVGQIPGAFSDLVPGR